MSCRNNEHQSNTVHKKKNEGTIVDLWPLLSRAWQGPVCLPPSSELLGPPPGTRLSLTGGWCRSLQSPEIHIKKEQECVNTTEVNKNRGRPSEITCWTPTCLGIDVGYECAVQYWWPVFSSLKLYSCTFKFTHLSSSSEYDCLFPRHNVKTPAA